MVELIYSLKEQGAFNNGMAETKRIVQHFEKTFSVQIDNPTRTFQEIFARITGNANYIHKLKDMSSRGLMRWRASILDKFIRLGSIYLNIIGKLV